jgi:hypothetical protein
LKLLKIVLGTRINKVKGPSAERIPQIFSSVIEKNSGFSKLRVIKILSGKHEDKSNLMTFNLTKFHILCMFQLQVMM